MLKYHYFQGIHTEVSQSVLEEGNFQNLLLHQSAGPLPAPKRPQLRITETDDVLGILYINITQ
jgi:hypothetical protein